MHPALVWLTLFAWTLALELPVYAALLRGRLRDVREACLVVVAVNLLTHPVLVIAGPGTGPALLGAELTVAIVEGVAVAAWLGRPAIVPALVAAAAANLVSTLGGLALSACLAR